MRRVLLLLLAMLAVAASACAEASTTVMVYMSGDTLESDDGSANEDLEEMIYAIRNGNDSVRVLAMTGGCVDWWNEEIPEDVLTIYEIGVEGLNARQTLPLASMGSAETLAQFVTYGLREAPADRYVLVLWGHGNGPTGGVCSDALFDGDSLMPDELARALESALPGGQKLDAVFFDTCLMGSIEIAQAIQPHADYMVASQESAVGTGLRYDRWLGTLMQDPLMDMAHLCQVAAQTYVNDNNLGRFGEMCTISVLDLSQTNAVTHAVEQLYGALKQRLESRPEEVLERRAELLSFGEFDQSGATDLVDALLIADAFEDMEPNACRALRESLQRMVVFNAASDDMADYAHGLSLMMPYATGDWVEPILEWYGPEAANSEYAALIVEMAKLAEQNYVAPQPAVPREEMCTGLLDSADEPKLSAKIPDPPDMWEGLLEQK